MNGRKSREGRIVQLADILVESTRAAGFSNGAQCLDRALAILVELAERSPIGCRLKEMSEFTGVPRPTVHRVLTRLVAAGLAMQERGTRLYKVGPFFHTLQSMNSRNRVLSEIGFDFSPIGRAVRTYGSPVGTQRALCPMLRACSGGLQSSGLRSRR